jgi:hypothetical protein
MTSMTGTTPVARNAVRVLAVTAALLLVPLAAMRFTDELRWDGMDFLAAGLLLGGTGLAWVLLAPRVRTARRRALLGAGLALALLLVWAELAVGILS